MKKLLICLFLFAASFCTYASSAKTAAVIEKNTSTLVNKHDSQVLTFNKNDKAGINAVKESAKANTALIIIIIDTGDEIWIIIIY